MATVAPVATVAAVVPERTAVVVPLAGEDGGREHAFLCLFCCLIKENKAAFVWKTLVGCWKCYTDIKIILTL